MSSPWCPIQHWHIDVSYINISGTFYYLCSILDGCSRYIVNWDLRESMTESDIEVILERAKELHPEAARNAPPLKASFQRRVFRDGRLSVDSCRCCACRAAHETSSRSDRG